MKNKSKGLISIIVPVYNVAPYLPKCLDSLVNQTYRDLEIICVNDGSKDNSLKILEEYFQKDKRIRIINRENRGISCSRNEALDIAQGEWTMFVDSDDWIDLNTCESALNLAIQHQSDVVMWVYMREFKNQSLPKYYIPQTTIWEENISQLHRRIVGPINEELSRPDTLDSWGTIWGKLYRSSFMQQESPIRFIDTKQIGSAEDVLFNIVYMGRISKAVYVPETWYHYRKGESYTSSYKADLPQKWEKLYQEIEKEITKQQLGKDFIQAYKNRISLGIIGLGINEMYAKTSLKEKYRDVILDEIEKNLKPGPAYYNTEEYTDQTLRQLAEETIREKALLLLQDEVPHGIYVEVEKMKFRKNQKGEPLYDIEATIYCLRNSHKGIIIGKDGSMLKRIGQSARIDMEKNFGTKVNLKTWVKVKENWLDDDTIVKKFKLQ